MPKKKKAKGKPDPTPEVKVKKGPGRPPKAPPVVAKKKSGSQAAPKSKAAITDFTKPPRKIPTWDHPKPCPLCKLCGKPVHPVCDCPTGHRVAMAVGIDPTTDKGYDWT